MFLGARAVAQRLQERRFDRRYQVDTAGRLYYDLHDAHLADAQPYAPVIPGRFQAALKSLALDPRESVFLDLGCGKGKALVLAAKAGFRKVVGVELSPALAEVAAANLAAVTSGTDTEFNVIACDASTFEIPPETLVLFLYNPFGERLVRAVRDNLERSIQAHPRKAFVVYINPVWASVFDECARFSPRLNRPGYAVYETLDP